jgi:hypothetical protein
MKNNAKGNFFKIPQITIDDNTMNIDRIHITVDKTQDPFKDLDIIVDNLAAKNLVDYPSLAKEEDKNKKK